MPGKQINARTTADRGTVARVSAKMQRHTDAGLGRKICRRERRMNIVYFSR